VIATHELCELGQSVWLDHLTHELVESGMLKQYRDGLSVTGLTSNPTSAAPPRIATTCSACWARVARHP
jgi:hypothetical protein